MPWQPRLPSPNRRGGRAEIDPVWLCSSISIELCRSGPAGLYCSHESHRGGIYHDYGWVATMAVCKVDAAGQKKFPAQFL